MNGSGQILACSESLSRSAIISAGCPARYRRAYVQIPPFLVSSQKVGRLAWRKVHDTDRGPGTSKKADWDESLLK
jgi:hypothetical protein